MKRSIAINRSWIYLIEIEIKYDKKKKTLLKPKN